MFRLISCNVNGLRSAASKGFVEWAIAKRADCMGLQEVRMQGDDLRAGGFESMGRLKGHQHIATKKGYSGVAMYTRHEPSDVRVGMGTQEFDDEGRWIELRYDTPARKLSLISAYFPSGSAGPERQAAKFRFLQAIEPHLAKLKRQREFIVVGDVNIAHREQDLKNWKSNQKNSGFTPEERAWMTQLTTKAKMVDVYRALEPDATDACYTWWSQRGQARANNVGWRIDYQIATPGLAALARRVTIEKTPYFSDHAPLIVDYDFKL